MMRCSPCFFGAAFQGKMMDNFTLFIILPVGEPENMDNFFLFMFWTVSGRENMNSLV